MQRTHCDIRRSYETSKLYRDLKLRGAIIKDKQLQILPQVQAASATGNLIRWWVAGARF